MTPFRKAYHRAWAGYLVLAIHTVYGAPWGADKVSSGRDNLEGDGVLSDGGANAHSTAG